MIADKQPATRADLTDEWVKGTCKIGQGHDCCRYLTFGPQGWDCQKHTSLRPYLDQRVATETINARGDNCLGVPVEAKDLVQ